MFENDRIINANDRLLLIMTVNFHPGLKDHDRIQIVYLDRVLNSIVYFAFHDRMPDRPRIKS